MRDRPSTRITDVRLIRLRTEREVGVVEPAWDPGGTWPLRIGGGSYVEVHTDTGLVGIGPGCSAALLPALREQLVGQDPFDIERHDAVLGYYAAGLPYEGTAGVDIALWDVIGKLCGQPLYKLWGGGRDRVVPYASLMRLSTPEERAQQAAGLRQAGWRALKVRLHHQTMQEDIRTVEAVREAVGNDMAIMVDANQAQSAGGWQPGVRWDFRRAVETARALQTLRCAWLEEPLPRFAYEQLAELRRRVELPSLAARTTPACTNSGTCCKTRCTTSCSPNASSSKASPPSARSASWPALSASRSSPTTAPGTSASSLTCILSRPAPTPPIWKSSTTPQSATIVTALPFFRTRPLSARTVASPFPRPPVWASSCGGT